jgi:uncharacterized protein YggU (UPF0235/DUF167 family)
MLIKVKVISHSKRQGVIKKAVDSFEVRVKSKPLHGQANKEAKEILAKYLEVPVNKVKIISGFRETNKIFSAPIIKSDKI